MQGLDQFREYDNLAELLKLIEDEGMSGEIVFVDVTSGKDDLRDFHLKVINDSDESIVTANKNPLSIYRAVKRPIHCLCDLPEIHRWPSPEIGTKYNSHLHGRVPYPPHC